MSSMNGFKVFMCLWFLSLASLVHAFEGTPRHMVFASDPQYPWTDKTDRRQPESDAEFEERSKWLVEKQFESIADFRKSHGGQANVPLMINGDMTAYGHPWQRNYINASLQKHFGADFLYGLGNHDYENNVNDCFGNRCAVSSVVDYYYHHVDKVDEFDMKRTGGGFDTVYAGSLAYSKTIGEVHMVQLNNEPTYTLDTINAADVRIKVSQSLDWLEKDLQLARVQGRAIIINMHKSSYWQGDWKLRERFADIVKKYEVTAIFAGHFHDQGGSVYGMGGVPVFLSGSASQETYLIASFSEDRKQLHVNLVENNQWQKRELVQTVPVNSVWARRP